MPAPCHPRARPLRAGQAAASALAAILFPAAAAAGTFTVTTLADSGPGSLRAAIAAANANPGPDEVRFEVDGTIRLLTPLEVTDDVRLDGSGRRVVLNGGDRITLLVANDERKTLHVARLTLEQANHSQSTGGAIISRGTLRVSESLFLGNVAPVGGALYVAGPRLVVENSTFAHNRALSWGGAIAVSATTQADISSSTFVANDAAEFGGTLFQNPIYVSHPKIGSMTVRNTVISGVAAKGNCSVISNRLVDGGGNLNSDSSCPFKADKGSVNDTHPMLGELLHHGGPTRTFAPLPGSPVVDSGVTLHARQARLDTDQRGYLRVAGPQVDKGAFEVQGNDRTASTRLTTAGGLAP
jgi:hypothetical protein